MLIYSFYFTAGCVLGNIGLKKDGPGDRPGLIQF